MQSPNIKDIVINNKKISKALQEIITLVDEGKLRHGDDLIREPVSTDLSWIGDPVLYQDANDDVFAKYNADKDSLELFSIQTFLDNINRRYIKKKEVARKEFNTVKQNVSSESLRKIVKNLEQAIFIDKKDDKDEDKYEESIGERVKLKSQNKVNDEEFNKEHATKYKRLDEITKELLGKKYNPKKAKKKLLMALNGLLIIIKTDY